MQFWTQCVSQVAVIRAMEGNGSLSQGLAGSQPATPRSVDTGTPLAPPKLPSNPGLESATSSFSPTSFTLSNSQAQAAHFSTTPTRQVSAPFTGETVQQNLADPTQNPSQKTEQCVLSRGMLGKGAWLNVCPLVKLHGSSSSDSSSYLESADERRTIRSLSGHLITCCVCMQACPNLASADEDVLTQAIWARRDKQILTCCVSAEADRQ